MTAEQTEETVEERRARRWKRRWTARAVGLLLVMPLIFFAIAAALMIDRDITAPSWVRDRVEARAATMLSGGDLAFGAITLNIGADLHPRIRLTDTTFRDAAGRRLADVAEISGVVSPRGLIFERSALVQEVRLSGVEIGLDRAEDGRVAVSFDQGETADAGPRAAGFVQLLERVDAVFDRPALAAFERVELAGLTLTYSDARAKRRWIIDGGRAALDLDGDALALSADLSLLSGDEVTQIALRYASPRGSRAATLSADLIDARSGDIATQSAALGWLAVIDAPVTARLRTTLDEDGELGVLSGVLDLGEGSVRAGDNAAPFGFQSAKTYLTYAPATRTIQFESLSVESDWGRFNARGQALGRDMDGGLPGSLLGQFTFADLSVAPPGLFPEPAVIDRVDVDLRLRLDPVSIEIGQAVLRQNGALAMLSGRAAPGPEGWDAAFDLKIPALDRDRLLSLWPESLRPGTRRWFAENIAAADLTEVAAGWRLAAGAKPRLAASFGFEDAEIRYFAPHPPITGATGHAYLSGDRFDVALAGGRVDPPQGGAVEVAGSHLAIPALSVRGSPIEVALAARSSITGALSLVDLPPLSYVSRANLPVTVADGRAETRLALSIPRKAQLRGNDITFDVGATLSRVASGIVPERRLTADRLALSVDRSGIVIEGAAALDGVPLRGSFTRAFVAGAAPEIDATVTLSPDALAAFDIALPPGMVSGAGPAKLALALPSGAPPTFSLRSDLKGIGVSIPAVGWTLGRSDTGTLAIDGALGQRPRIDSLQIGGSGLNAQGDITFDANGQFEAARFAGVRIGGWLNAPVTLRSRGAGQPVGIAINGGTLDLRRARFGGTGGGGPAGGPIQIALDRLIVAGGIELRDFTGDFDARGGFSGRFGARVNGGTAIRGVVAPRNGSTAVRVQSDDAGGVVRSAGLTQNTAGGALDLVLVPTGAEGTFDGSLSVTGGVRVRDAPAMAALLDAISVVGLLQQLDGQGLAFDTLEARFRLTPAQLIVTESSAVGPGLGISLDGIYTLASKRLDFQGVVSPFYLVNAIGSIFTRRGEGLIGFNFNLGGTADAPQVSVNPLSALTPGMFREIFRRPPPEVSP